MQNRGDRGISVPGRQPYCFEVLQPSGCGEDFPLSGRKAGKPVPAFALELTCGHGQVHCHGFSVEPIALHTTPVPALVRLCHRVKAQDNGLVIGVTRNVGPRLPLVRSRQRGAAGAAPLAPVLLVGVVPTRVRAS